MDSLPSNRIYHSVQPTSQSIPPNRPLPEALRANLIVKMLIVSIILLASQISVHACEGDCIVGITNAWVGNYTSPVNNVFRELVRFRTTAPRSCPLMLRRLDNFHKS